MRPPPTPVPGGTRAGARRVQRRARTRQVRRETLPGPQVLRAGPTRGRRQSLPFHARVGGLVPETVRDRSTSRRLTVERQHDFAEGVENCLEHGSSEDTAKRAPTRTSAGVTRTPGEPSQHRACDLPSRARRARLELVGACVGQRAQRARLPVPVSGDRDPPWHGRWRSSWDASPVTAELPTAGRRHPGMWRTPGRPTRDATP